MDKFALAYPGQLADQARTLTTDAFGAQGRVDRVAGLVDGAEGVRFVVGEPRALLTLLALDEALRGGVGRSEAQEGPYALPGNVALLPQGRGGETSEYGEGSQEKGGHFE